MKELTPREIVRELDRYIIGQEEAKRAVAIALRNRYRRSRVDEAMREEIFPKNILMIGPTGVGKTEIARRLAKLVQAPFVKVEATKFTEVGYVGRDVESIVRDLVENAVRMVRDGSSIRPRSPAAIPSQLSWPPMETMSLLFPMRKRTACVPARSRCARKCAGANGRTRKSRSRWRKRLPNWKWAATPSAWGT